MDNLNLTHKDEAVFRALSALLSTKNEEEIKRGVTSREIANTCGLDIYSTRYTLLKLTRMELVELCSPPGKKQSSWGVRKKTPYDSMTLV